MAAKGITPSIWKLANLKKLSLGCRWDQGIYMVTHHYKIAKSFDVQNEIRNLTMLEQLDFDWLPIRSLPRSIGKMKNLKAPDLTSTDVKEIPKEVGNLINLESLGIVLAAVDWKSNESEIQRLSPCQIRYGIWENLWHLHRSGNRRPRWLQSLPKAIYKLTNLQEISLARLKSH